MITIKLKHIIDNIEYWIDENGDFYIRDGNKND